MVCVVCSCCTTSPYREVCRAKGGIGSGETLCHDIYPARPITVSLAANTYCMMDGHSSSAPRTVALKVQFSSVCVNRAIDDWPAHTAGGHLLSVAQAATNTSSSRMHIINHNWLATKQRLHLQSAKCSRDKPPFSFVRGTGFDNVRHRLGLATRTQISV